MVKISEISFKNFRQYKDIKIVFDSPNSNLYVLRAKNGTGKTTFLNGILWCLYGNEYYSSNKEGLKILNDYVSEHSEMNDRPFVTVSIKLETEDGYAVITRKQAFVIKMDYVKNIRKVDEVSKSEMNVLVNYNDPTKNAEQYFDDEAYSYVKKYFDESIYNYFFFDGENLHSFFDNSDDIRNSIFQISQVNLLQDAADHTIGMANELSREANKEVEGSTELYERQTELNGKINAAKKDNIRIANEMPGLEKDISSLQDKYNKIEPVKNKLKEREKLDRDLTSIEKDLESVKAERSDFIRKYLVLFNYRTRIEKTFDLICRKEAEGALPPSIDTNQIRDIIDNHVTHCPLCDGHIDEHALQFLNDLLEKYDYSTKTGSLLREIKVSLNDFNRELAKYNQEKNRILTRLSTLEEAKKEIETNLNEIKQYLTHNDFGTDTASIQKLETQLQNLKTQRDLNIKQGGINDQVLDTCSKELEQVNDDIEKLESEQSNKNELNKKVSIYRQLSSAFEGVREKIMNEVKKDIEGSTWDFFSSMNWKTHSFGKININDNYDVFVTNQNGKNITGSLSGAEKMSLAYSFTLAIHKASGKNCPLVVDSPLGRSSDENREGIAKRLLDVSANKQIIMLFTPDEYSEQVEKVYIGNASIRDIVLSDDEQEISKIGE